MKEYEKQAQDFLLKTGTKLTITFDRYDKYFSDDKECRNIYKCKLTRNKKQYSFMFGSSIRNTENDEEPTAYDILACLEKYEVGTFEDFLANFGYEITSNESYKSIMKSYKAVCREYKAVMRLFEDVIDDLQEIN